MEIYNLTTLSELSEVSRPVISNRLDKNIILSIKKPMKTKTKIYIPSILIDYFLYRSKKLLNTKDIKLKEAILKIQNNNNLYTKNSKCKVLSIANIKGGVGKTVISFNLSHSLAFLKKRVLVVDLDPQANLSFYTDMIDSELISIKDLLKDIFNKKRLSKEDIKRAIQTKEYENASIDVLPSHILLGKILEYGRSVADNPHKGLHKILKELKDDYDYIIIDTPPSPGIAQQLAIYATDELIAATMPDEFSIMGLEELIQESKYIKDEFEKDNLKIDAIFINSVKNSNICKVNVEAICELAQEENISNIITIPENSKISESITLKIPLLEYKADLDSDMKGSKRVLEYAFHKILRDEDEQN